MIILGISAFYHDSAVCLIIDNKIVAAAQEERFNRKKHYAGFPVNAIKYCLEQENLKLDDIDFVVFYEKPLLKLERLLKTFYKHAPFGYLFFQTALKSLIYKQLFFTGTIIKNLRKIEKFDSKKLLIKYSEHHLSHAASSFFASPYYESAILTIDGVGEWSTTSISHGINNNIKILKELQFPNSLGLFYSSFTYFLGFRVNSGEYKLMGLAPYGNPTSEQTKTFKRIILSNLIKIFEDGSIQLNPRFFTYSYKLKMISPTKWEKIFGLKRREPNEKLENNHCDLAYAVQEITEEVILKMAKEAKRLTNSNNLCLAGGVALNSVAVGKLLRNDLFDQVYIQPASGDAGGAVGSALALNYIGLGRARKIDPSEDIMNYSYLGPEFSNKTIEEFNNNNELDFEYFEDFNDLTKLVARKIAEGSIVGWFQGRMEFGPRALGNRSILADARSPKNQFRINQFIKNREIFRPLAPSVLFEDLKLYFDSERSENYMCSTVMLRQEKKYTLPKDYTSLSLIDKLKTKRSQIQSTVHVDFTSRIQTVNNNTNPKFWGLLMEFKKITNCPVLLNTSFNIAGEPIVCSPQDAYNTFKNSSLDFLVMNNFIYFREKVL